MTPPEMSRPVVIESLKRPQSRHRVHATAAERVALAARFGLLDLAALDAELVLEFLAGDRELRVSGRLRATVTQACVVSLEPVIDHLDEAVKVEFSRDAPEDETVEHSLGGGEFADGGPLYEPWPGPILDLGELVAQELALSINPYPRAADARLPEPGSVTDNPFAVLRPRPGKGSA